jgi:hypothetical protein
MRLSSTSRFLSEVACVLFLGIALICMILSFALLGIVAIVTAMFVRENLFTNTYAALPSKIQVLKRPAQSVSPSGLYPRALPEPHAAISAHPFPCDCLSAARR